MNIAFYTEAGSLKGMGHLVRCYTIAQEFKKNKHTIHFYLDSDLNFDYKFENLKYFKWDTLDFTQKYDVVFIDSYLASLDIYENIFNSCKLLVSIDDYGRLDYPKSVILNFAPDSQKLFFKNKKIGYTYLLGLDYIPLRQKILDTISNKKEQIFIMLGGMDIANLTVNILNSIQDINIKKVIVIDDEKIAQQLQKYKNVRVLCKPTDQELIQNMANSTVAISTASMSIYELNYFEIPTIIVALNKNQQIGATQLLKHKLASKLLDIESDQWEKDLNENISYILKNSIPLPSIIDGKGVDNIYTSILQLVKK